LLIVPLLMPDHKRFSSWAGWDSDAVIWFGLLIWPA
jgi:hypothetical protein